jgi:hypothetical protein
MKISVTGFLLAVLPCCVQGGSFADGKADVALFANCAGLDGQGEVVEGDCDFEIDDRRHLRDDRRNLRGGRRGLKSSRNRGDAGFFAVFTSCDLEGTDGMEYMIEDGVINFEDVEYDVDSFDDAEGNVVPEEVRIERTFHDKVFLKEKETGIMVAKGTKITRLTIIEPDSGDEHLDRIDQVSIVWDQDDCESFRDGISTDKPQGFLFVGSGGSGD